MILNSVVLPMYSLMSYFFIFVLFSLDKRYLIINDSTYSYVATSLCFGFFGEKILDNFITTLTFIGSRSFHIPILDLGTFHPLISNIRDIIGILKIDFITKHIYDISIVNCQLHHVIIRYLFYIIFVFSSSSYIFISF